ARSLGQAAGLTPAAARWYDTHHWLRGWALAALAGFLVMGTYYDHYTAALLPSLSVLIAPALGTDAPRRVVTALVFAFLLVAGSAILVSNRIGFGGARDLAVAARAIEANLDGRCLYVFEGNAALYSATSACMVSKYAFPQHLSGATDAVALGEDSRAALARALARRPGVIVTGQKPLQSRSNWAVWPLMGRTLARDYEAFADVRLGHVKLRLWRLRKARAPSR
ncbi:hypothetical protein MTR62_06075, partial [Novosphingobium sp. 1949]|nr:hypothetical protein [Novosphingobium organovorum]